MAKRYIFCGSRDWTDTNLIRVVLKKLIDDGLTTVIHGDNGYDESGKMLYGRPDSEAVRGLDKLAGWIAESEFGLEVIRVSADWYELGKAAGPERNQRMLDLHNPDGVVAFTYDLSKSSGTRDMVNRASLFGVPVIMAVEEFSHA